ncbi:hypothetical protein [Azospirillum brasilense]|uniref:hypothetical protein n=1 Tax=Azospirillum brasilense TaxID=192 RepID=UPI000E688168|nr:hypothetical protein [Azospirillum brasilense]NUB27456.1 hypothetical protein [Azospirillum brasilense]NUB35027.1 hypothetical protein [Azospirillum brasilense]RIV99189.1 hypothetical protein D2T81_24035 [Azospirillum brasilense]
MFSIKRYGVELSGALALYAALLLGANAADRLLQPEGAMKIALALLPILGTVAVAWTVLRGLRRMDELQRRIQFDAIAVSFTGTALATFAWGFAEGAGAPELRAFHVWPLMAVLWVVGVCVAQWRYR